MGKAIVALGVKEPLQNDQLCHVEFFWFGLICPLHNQDLGPAATNAARGRTTAIEVAVPNKETTFPSSWASETSQVLTDLHLENQELLVHSLNPECA